MLEKALHKRVSQHVFAWVSFLAFGLFFFFVFLFPSLLSVSVREFVIYCSFQYNFKYPGLFIFGAWATCDMQVMWHFLSYKSTVAEVGGDVCLHPKFVCIQKGENAF